MGVLLREALKTICLNNQWSYAVFWKIGCQNANLLIWEECYYESLMSSLPPRISGIKSSQPDSMPHAKVHLLISRMMLNNRIILVGEGMVGRAAFTGNIQWMLANSYNRDAHPPEVVNELLLQFSAGIQTVAVIPVHPHGVVQLGSHLHIMENLGFVNDVRSLILQLGCVPGTLFSDNYGPQDSADLIGVPVTVMTPSGTHETVKQSALTNPVDDQIKNVKSENHFGEWQRNGFFGAEVIPSNLNSWPNQNFSSCNSRGSQSGLGLVEHRILSNAGFQENGANVDLSNAGFQENGANVDLMNISNASRARNKDLGSRSADMCSEMPTQPSSENDLFDILGLDPKSNAFNESWSYVYDDGSDAKTENLSKELSTLMNIQETVSDIYSGTDHLLDAIVSGACSVSKQIMDDTESCRTTLTKISNSSEAKNTSNAFDGGLFEIPKAETSGTVGSSCFQSGLGKDITGTCSQTTSAYGSQISSWVEQAHSVKRESSVSTAYSKMKNETLKPNRKRLKPGENPRPRPKDRQMIQDRVKELREIIPNGAKCSIDGLLERTIKHMLYLQSVTKHADKLKQTEESKIITKEGGATWAFEVGSQSMLCPIVVEDLSPPRNFLVEMLCEERGFFLEIADWIRGLGLTILKGVMEARNDKIWARFVVEANRDVARMEIFMSLVNLLEQTMKCVGPTNNILDGINGSMTMMNAFSQAASIPVTGGGSV